MTDKIEDLIDFMTYKFKGVHVPLFAEKVNGNYIIAVYQGSRGGNPELDFIIKYKQKINGQFQKGKRPRQPSHIHWAVDILIKMHAEPEKTKEFLDFLLNMWDNTNALKNRKNRDDSLNLEVLLNNYEKEIDYYNELGQKGEYSIKFLILLLKLLIIQEKTSSADAYMFKKVLNQIKEDKAIYKVVSAAIYRGN